MIIHYIDESPLLAARYLTDKDVAFSIKMAAQLLSTAHRLLDGYPKKSTVNGKSRIRFCMGDIEKHNALLTNVHNDDPLSIWIRSSSENYKWTYQWFLHLMSEYNARTESKHKLESLVKWLAPTPNNIDQGPFSIPPAPQLLTPTVEHYRIFYRTQNTPQPSLWTNRKVPEWMAYNL